MLVVIPLASDETDALTLGEWDLLVERGQVLFDDANHPLIARLRRHDIEVRVVSEPPDVSGDDVVVVQPSSSWILDLARRGAEVTSGATPAPDSLTAAHGAAIVRRGSAALGSLIQVMARLRSDDGCPWDREQSHASLRIHLVEEAYEVLDAIDRDSVTDELEEELGDLLLQVVFHSQMAADDDRFDVAAVARSIVAKLIHRHPHVFGDRSVADADEVIRNWEEIKKEEKERGGPFEGIPVGLPALLAAYKVQKRAASLGFQPDETEARERLAEVVADSPDVGAALFWLVALARAMGVDPEGALREETSAFKGRYETG